MDDKTKEKISNFRCLVCDEVGDWENVDKYRQKPEGMHVCKCGFVSYPSKYETVEQIKERYRVSYRNPPNVNNLFTGQTKLNLHRHFLSDVFEEYKEKDNKDLVFCDVGAAMGMTLKWFRDLFPGSDVNGTELTLSYRRVAWHEYGVRLDEDFDYSKKYDLIMSYKVSEHQLDADKLLRGYVECLKDDGKFYISVPIWFKTMTNFGLDGFDIEYYYSPDHINTWSRKHFEHVLNKAGLEVIKEDTLMYDTTYLCKRNDSLMTKKIELEGREKVLKDLDNVKNAFDAFTAGKYDTAYQIFPNYPLAYKVYYETHRKEFEEKGMEWIVKDWLPMVLKNCEDNGRAIHHAIDLTFRYQLFEECLQYCQKAEKIRGGDAGAVMKMSQCLGLLADLFCPVEQKKLIDEQKIQPIKEANEERSQHLRKEARNLLVYLQKISEKTRDVAVNFRFLHDAKIPMPNE